MFSTLPKLAESAVPRLGDKFFIGYLFPVVAFLASLLFLFSDMPFFADMTRLLKSAIANSLYLTLTIFGLSIILFLWGLIVIMLILNHNIYQFVEGYGWPIPQIAKFLGRPELRRFRKKYKQWNDLRQQWKAAIVAGDKFPVADERQHDELEYELVTQFPFPLDVEVPSEDKELAEILLPTRFGNAIRAFEDYPRAVYGADPIPLWIHLNTVMSNEFRHSVEDARFPVTFLMNLFVLSVVVFVLVILRFVFYLYEDERTVGVLSCSIANCRSMSLGLLAICTAVFAWVTYKLSIEKVYEWGRFVKAAFDCYLPDLATKLGHKLPLMEEERERFWILVSRRAIFHRKFKPEEWPRADNTESPDRWRQRPLSVPSALRKS